MKIAVGLVIVVFTSILMLNYLNGKMSKKFNEYGFLAMFLTMILMGLGQWMVISELFPPTQWPEKPPVQKELNCGTTPISS
ncbi:hypothetical protein [Pseudomonas phage D6]|nr:hypothetical protein [Pseudomonas phage D6]